MNAANSLTDLLTQMGIKLKDLRLARKETLRMAAANLHLSEATLRKIEQGQYHNLKVDTVGALADYYEVTFKYLISKQE